MNVDQALLAFREDEEKRSREAVQWALEHWDEASSRLLSRLRATLPILPLVYDAKDKAFDESDGVMVYYLMHLFAEKRDVRAYAPLCQRLQRERDVMVWLMDVAGDTLPGVLIALYDGDPEPLQRVVESAEADPLVRVAALGALCYIIRFEQALGEGAARDYLRRLYEHALPRGKSDFWEGWINAVALLGCSELAPDVARLFSKGWIDPEVATIQDFHGLLGEARADPKKAFDTFKLVPFASTMALLDAREASGAHFGDLLNDEETGEAYQTPHLNPLREVGRNDPCPCGSGKKYKKCCLAA